MPGSFQFRSEEEFDFEDVGDEIAYLRRLAADIDIKSLGVLDEVSMPALRVSVVVGEQSLEVDGCSAHFFLDSFNFCDLASTPFASFSL